MANQRVGNKRGQDRVTLIQKEQRCIELRLSGMSLAAIARTVGYVNESGAQRAIMRGLNRTMQEPADDLRKMEAERLNKVIFANWKGMLAGDPHASAVILKAIDMRAKLFGLYAPLRLNWQMMVRSIAEDLGLSQDEMKAMHDDVARHLVEAQASGALNP